MNIVCTCQEEFNAIPDDFCGKIEIRFGDASNPAVVDRMFPLADIYVDGDTSVCVCDEAKIFANREEQRENQVAVPMSEQEKKRIKEAAKKTDRSMASFIRMVLNEYFEKEEK